VKAAASRGLGARRDRACNPSLDETLASSTLERPHPRATRRGSCGAFSLIHTPPCMPILAEALGEFGRLLLVDTRAKDERSGLQVSSQAINQYDNSCTLLRSEVCAPAREYLRTQHRQIVIISKALC